MNFFTEFHYVYSALENVPDNDGIHLAVYMIRNFFITSSTENDFMKCRPSKHVRIRWTDSRGRGMISGSSDELLVKYTIVVTRKKRSF